MKAQTLPISLFGAGLFLMASEASAQFEIGDLSYKPEHLTYSDRLGTQYANWTTSKINFESGYSNGPLSSSKIDVNVCSDHFPKGSPAWKEVETGLNYYRQVSGLELNLKFGSYAHESIEERYPLIPQAHEIKIDYAYNTGNQGYIPCHTPTSQDPATRTDEQWGFTGNSCSFFTFGWGNNSSLKTHAGRVNINPLAVGFDPSTQSEFKSTRYRHFWESTGKTPPYPSNHPDSLGYAKAPLFSHEVGHALGLRHTDDWRAAKGMISTMQSHIRTITPFDLAYLISQYGLDSNPASDIRKSDLVVSHLVRINHGPGEKDYGNYNFDTDETNELGRINPIYLYATKNYYLDCRTDLHPRFHLNWFNNGLTSIQSDPRLSAHFEIQSTGKETRFKPLNSPKISLYRFQIPKMEGLSQSYLSTQLKIPATLSGPSLLNEVAEVTLSVTLDDQNSLSEASESNNQIQAKVYLLKSRDYCRRSSVLRAMSAYTKPDGTVRGY